MTDTTDGSRGPTAAGSLGEIGQHRRPRHARAGRRVRRAPPAGRGADRRLRALRLLPADLPDLRAVGRGDGLPARADLPDEGGPRGRADERRDGVALGRLPRLHGLRDRLPVRACSTTGSSSRPGPRSSAATTAAAATGRCAALIFALFPHPRRLRLLRGPLRASRRTGLDRGAAAHRPARAAGAAAGGDGEPGAPAGQARAAARAHRRRRASAARSSACSPAACRARSSRASTPRPRGCCRPRAATWSCPRQQGCCGALSVHNGREAEAQGFARRLVDAFEATGVEHVVVNAAGCGSTMKEYAELLADDPAYADRARAFAEKVRDVSRDPRRARPGRARGTRCAMTVAYHDACHLGARPGRPRPAAARCSRRSPGWSCRRSPRPSCAAARPASTTSSTPSRPASSATARRPTSSPPARRCWSPPTRAA